MRTAHAEEFPVELGPMLKAAYNTVEKKRKDYTFMLIT